MKAVREEIGIEVSLAGHTVGLVTWSDGRLKFSESGPRQGNKVTGEDYS